MPISTQCPKCLKLYKLKDELLGKRVACADTNCRTLFEVKPYTPPPKPAVKKMDAEAIALAALNDDPDPAVALPEDLRKITMTCAACDHKYEVAWAMQGKNALCPECKFRQKVPEQAVSTKVDWRNPNAKRPSLAKQEEVPDDVWGSKQGQVSIGALKEAGAIKGVEYESRPVSFWLKIGTALAVVLVLGSAGGYYLYQSKKHDSQIKLIDDAEADFNAFKGAGLPPTTAPQFQAFSHIATTEFRGRLADTPAGLKTAIQGLTAARQSLQDPAARGMDRDMLAVEMISVIIALAGDSEQIKTGGKIPWAPGISKGKSPPLSTVINELQACFQTMLGNSAELDLRLMALRRATRELEVRGQGSLAESIIGSGFRPEEQIEATAVVALELARLGGSPTKTVEDAENVKQQFAANAENIPAPAYALWLLANVTGPNSPPPPPGSGVANLSTRLTFTQLYLAKKQTADALAVAKLPGPPDERLRAIALVAELSPVPAEAVAAAMEIVGPVGPKPVVPQSVYARLAFAAGAAGDAAAVDSFVAAISDEGLKVWARADAVHAKILANPTTKADDTTTTPEDVKKLRVGNAWVKFVVFRHNVRVANSGLEAAAKALPAGTLRPFALYGLALGAQDGVVR